MKKLLRTCALTIGLMLASIAPSYATSTLAFPTPVPTSASPNALPTHIPTYEQLSSCYHNSNGNCPAPSGAGSVSDYKVLGGAVTYNETGPTATLLNRQAGIKAGFYTDPVFIHGGINYMGTNQCSGGSSVFPYAILQHDRSWGSPILSPSSNQGSCGSYTVGTILGDPASPALWSYWQAVALYNNDTVQISSYGNTYTTRRGNYYIRFDDMLADYNAQAYGWVLCAGYGTLSATGTFTACGQSSPNLTNISNPSGGTYTETAETLEYPTQAWPDIAGPARDQGTKNFFRAMGQIGLKVIFNDDTNPDVSEAWGNDPDHDNIEMGQCENCLVNGTSPYSDTTWRTHVDTLIYNNQHGWGLSFFNPIIGSYGMMEYVYASVWLGMGNPWLVSVKEQVSNSLSNPSSGIPISPLTYLIPTQPINDPNGMYLDPWQIGYNPNSPPANYMVGALQHGTGVYVREFNTCYDMQSGTPVSKGHCAAIVATPAAAASTTISSLGLTNSYAHQVAFSGTGILTNSAYGDSFSLSETTAAPTSISSSTALLLFQ